MPFWYPEQIEIAVDASGMDRLAVLLEQPFARIGSHPQSDLVLNGGTCPKRSSYLHATPEGIFCVSLVKPLSDAFPQSRWLAGNETLDLAPYRLNVGFASGRAVPHSLHASLLTHGSVPPFPLIQVFYRDRPMVKRRLRAPLSLIGRYPGCVLQLQGKLVSGFHCGLYWNQQRLWCIDFNSSNKTRLNGLAIDCAEVFVGDRVEVGEFALVFRRLSHSSAVETSDKQAFSVRKIIADELGEPLDPGDQTVCSLRIDNQDFLAANQAPQVEPAAPTPAPASQVIIPAPVQPDWEAAAALVRDQMQQLQAQANHLSQVRTAFEQERRSWESQRNELTRQLLAQSERLMQIESERAAKGSPPSSPLVLEAVISPAELTRAGQSSPFPVAGVITSVAVSAEGRDDSAPAERAPPQNRGKVPRDQLSTFLGDRLVEIERVRRRRQMLIWGAAILTASGLVAASLLFWNWLGLPLP